MSSGIWKEIKPYNYKDRYVTEIMAYEEEFGEGKNIAKIIFPGDMMEQNIELIYLNEKAKTDVYAQEVIKHVLSEKKLILEEIKKSTGEINEGYYFQLDMNVKNLPRIKELENVLKDKKGSFKKELGTKDEKIILFKILFREKHGNELDKRSDKFSNILLKSHVYQEFQKNEVLDKITTWKSLKE